MKPIHIAMIVDRYTKSNRDRTAGVFRFAGGTPNWELHFISPDLDVRETNRVLAELRPDGIILSARALPTRRRTCPVVGIDVFYPPHAPPDAHLVCDDVGIGRLAAQRLLTRGFPHFAYIGTTRVIERGHSSARLDAFKSTLGADCAVFFDLDSKSLRHNLNPNQLDDWLRSLPKPCGVFVYMDFFAQPLLDACRRLQLRVPEQIGVISVDNEVEVCENCDPTLSSIEPDFEGAGFRAASLLDRFIRTGRPARPITETYGIKTLHERMSSQDVAGSMRRVALACERIRLQAASGLTVAQLARDLGVSTRMLEYSFKNTLGHSVREELIRTRLERVQELLRATDTPLGELSYLTGFGVPANLKAIFRQRLGVTMREWRAAHAK